MMIPKETRRATLERLYSMMDSKAFREYSMRRLEQQENAAKEASDKLNDQLKVALERKTTTVNPNESKPKLSLRNQKNKSC